MDTINEGCIGCIHLSAFSSGVNLPYKGENENLCCNYFLNTGNLRKSAPGAKCKKKCTDISKLNTPMISGLSVWMGTNNKASNTKKKEETKKSKRPENITHTKRDAEWMKKPYHVRVRETMQGRQKQAILAYKNEHNLSYNDMGKMLGVSGKTVSAWAMEAKNANWKKLAELGIKKPDGI